MIITKKSLPRRMFLRGLGATVALPMLDAMAPAWRLPLHPPQNRPFVSDSSTFRTVSSWIAGLRRKPVLALSSRRR